MLACQYMQLYNDEWNLGSIPAERFASEAARRRAAARSTHAGGRPPVPTPCPRCGETCPSVMEAKRHCPMVAGRPKEERHCTRCGAIVEGAVEARNHCRVSRKP